MLSVALCYRNRIKLRPFRSYFLSEQSLNWALFFFLSIATGYTAGPTNGSYLEGELSEKATRSDAGKTPEFNGSMHRLSLKMIHNRVLSNTDQSLLLQSEEKEHSNSHPSRSSQACHVATPQQRTSEFAYSLSNIPER